MDKFRKLLHETYLIAFCLMLFLGCFTNTYSVSAANRTTTINRMIKASKKDTEVSKEKSSKKKSSTKNTKNTKKKRESYDYSWITKGSTGDKNFEKYTDNFKAEVGSLVELLIVIAIIVAGTTIKIVGTKYSCTKNGTEKRENHERLITLVFVICAILGLGTILALAQQIGEKLFS